MKLKPCPFCGGEAEAVIEIDGFWTVECIECGALADGIAAWNARAERTCRDVSVDSTTQFYCSECECTVDVPLLWGEINFCPNCGAKVIEEKGKGNGRE